MYNVSDTPQHNNCVPIILAMPCVSLLSEFPRKGLKLGLTWLFHGFTHVAQGRKEDHVVDVLCELIDTNEGTPCAQY